MSFVDRAHRIFISNNARLWTNIVYGVATYKILVTTMHDISEGIWVGWMGIAGGIELTKRWMASKTGITSETPDDDQNPDQPVDTRPPRPIGRDR